MHAVTSSDISDNLGPVMTLIVEVKIDMQSMWHKKYAI